MAEPHPLVLQLRFTRSEFMRAIRRVDDADARRRILPMNCISWNVGHLAWQEQRYFVTMWPLSSTVSPGALSTTSGVSKYCATGSLP